MLRLTWLQFTFFNSLMIVLLNFNLFYFVYEKNTQNWFITFVFIVAYFALVHVICSLLFIKFFTKFFSILFIISSFLSVYFISFYGVRGIPMKLLIKKHLLQILKEPLQDKICKKEVSYKCDELVYTFKEENHQIILNITN